MENHFFKDLFSSKWGALAAIGALAASWVRPHYKRRWLSLIANVLKLSHVVLFLLYGERRLQASHVIKETSQRPNVHFKVKGLTSEHFRCRVERCSQLANWNALRLRISHRNWYSHVCNPNSHIFHHEYILWFDVFVDDIFSMQILETQDNSSANAPDFFFFNYTFIRLSLVD